MRLSETNKRAAIAHIQNLIPVCDLGVRDEVKEQIAQIGHVYHLYSQDPTIDTRAIFFELQKLRQPDGYGKGRGNACKNAKASDELLHYVIDNIDLERQAEIRRFLETCP